MTFKGWTVAAGLVLLAPGAPHAATEANFGPATTADLVELCTATPDNAMADRDSVRSGTGTTRRWTWLTCDPATPVPI